MPPRRCAGTPGNPCRTWVANTRRCTRCAQAWERNRRPNFRQRGYDAEYERIRKTLLGKPCHWCGVPSDTADHLIPISKGGTNADLVPACAKCNYGRGNRTK